MKVVAYLKTTCGWSAGVREVFDRYNIEYEETITDSRGKKINWIKEFFTNLNPDPYGNK